jgi:predicted membrane channel-forming protein YqfA (hemolysin III family)
MNAQLSARESSPISLGDWIITLIVLAIPIVGIVMLFVWGFSSGTHPSKQNYCRAVLIIALAALVLFFLIAIMGGFAALSLFHAGGTSL